MYCWQYLDSGMLRMWASLVVSILFNGLEFDEQRRVIGEVVTTEQIARRLLSRVCGDLDSRHLVATQLMHQPRLLSLLVHHSPHVTTVSTKGANVLLSVASYCQRQLCGGRLQELSDVYHVDVISDCFSAVT